SPSPTSSSSATASTSPRSTATCRSSGSSKESTDGLDRALHVHLALEVAEAAGELVGGVEVLDDRDRAGGLDELDLAARLVGHDEELGGLGLQRLHHHRAGEIGEAGADDGEVEGRAGDEVEALAAGLGAGEEEVRDEAGL